METLSTSVVIWLLISCEPSMGSLEGHVCTLWIESCLQQQKEARTVQDLLSTDPGLDVSWNFPPPTSDLMWEINGIVWNNFSSALPLWRAAVGALAGLPGTMRVTSISFSEKRRTLPVGQLRSFSSLQHLDIWGGTITRAELAAISQNRNLRYLSFCDCHLPRNPLEMLLALKHLESLDLAGTGIRSEDLSVLPHFQKLAELYLVEDYDVDDCALKYISKLPALQLLDIRGTSISQHGYEMLEKQFPKAFIFTDPRLKDKTECTCFGVRPAPRLRCHRIGKPAAN